MLRQLIGGAFRRKVSVLSVAALAGLAFAAGFGLGQPTPALAHCDSANGPVVTAAQRALDSGDVRLALAYVQPEAEAELTAAFQQAAQVRGLGGEAQKLADQYFFETTVRLHRAGEGASYTGLKQETDHGPALVAADGALETGSLDGVYSLFDKVVRETVAQKYQAVLTAREEAATEGTVAADRERAEAELIFEKYVYGLYQTALGASVQAEGAPAAGGHTHGEGAQPVTAHDPLAVEAGSGS